MKKIRITVCGAAGRMGGAVIAEIKKSAAAELAGAVDISGDFSRPDNFPELLEKSDAAIDFSSPASAVAFARDCAAAGVPFVCGVTGFTGEQTESLKKSAVRVPVFWSPNMSPAVNLSIAMCAFAAGRLPGFDIHIHETHHKAKKDIPSGTALRCAAEIKEAAGIDVPITSARIGDIAGVHSITFAGPHESIELVHRAYSRAVFAEGALRACLWTVSQKAGFYTYGDLLGLKK